MAGKRRPIAPWAPGRADVPHPPGRAHFAARGVAPNCGVRPRGATRARLAAKIAAKPTAVKRVNIKDLWY